MGDAYPSASVIGIDAANIQPAWVPPNVKFFVDDLEQEFLDEDVDLVHFRFMTPVLRNVPVVLGHAYK